MKVVSWDGNNINDGTNYRAWLIDALGLPAVRPVMAARANRWPILAGVTRPGDQVQVRIAFEGASSGYRAKRRQLQQWFDPEDETAKQLIIEDYDGTLDRFVEGICRDLQADLSTRGQVYVASIEITDDVRWRESALNSDVWNITATGQTNAINNTGEDETYPTYEIKPTSGKTNAWSFSRYIKIRWLSDARSVNYPIDVADGNFDGAAAITASKMRADGFDLRIIVNGAERERWLADINSTGTEVWTYLDFEARQEATLTNAMGSGDTVTEIEVDEDISGFPDEGILFLDNEAFVYTSKNLQERKFEGVSRAAKRTTAAAHSAGITIWWNQNDIWMIYGLPGATDPDYPDTFKPIFDISGNQSSNSNWLYNEFGSGGGATGARGVRPGSWFFSQDLRLPQKYTANRDTDADPWEEMGIRVSAAETLERGFLQYIGRWTLHIPTGIDFANFQNGEKRIDSVHNWEAKIQSKLGSGGLVSGWFTEDTIAKPTAEATWQTWSDNEDLQTNATTVSLMLLVELDPYISDAAGYLEVADVDITLPVGTYPLPVVSAELTNYQLNATLTNNTTGEAIKLFFPMKIDETLEIDTFAQTVKYLEDGSNQFNVLEVVGGPRKWWLLLAEGSNTFQWDEAGVAGLTVTTKYRRRYYS